MNGVFLILLIHRVSLSGIQQLPVDLGDGKWG